ncbi:hypothetical protein AB1Y20_010879 [Prymnesium parvum]|uniref:Glycerophosphocholine acyltransferase 1 n=1 Tax=Prymnesium parvum TaxID=97485 RepID=A0AB34ISN8_PRYPA
MAKKVSQQRACPSNESLQLLAYEWKADRRDLVLDGRHWRELFGGSIGDAPKLGAYICCGPSSFMIFRALAAITILAFLGLRLYYAADGVSWLLYFNHWVLILASAYFTLAATLTFAAIYSWGYAAQQTPLVVAIINIIYGVLLPAALVNALASGLVFYTYDKMFVDTDTTLRSLTDLASTFGVLAMAWLDLILNRQPYYASYHALLGCVFCWGYILFTVICYAADVTDSQGHRYIYPYLAWGVPLQGGGAITGAKLLLMNLFLLTPLINYFYWFLVWARRRVHISTKSLEH